MLFPTKNYRVQIILKTYFFLINSDSRTQDNDSRPSTPPAKQNRHTGAVCVVSEKWNFTPLPDTMVRDLSKVTTLHFRVFRVINLQIRLWSQSSKMWSLASLMPKSAHWALVRISHIARFLIKTLVAFFYQCFVLISFYHFPTTRV